MMMKQKYVLSGVTNENAMEWSKALKEDLTISMIEGKIYLIMNLTLLEAVRLWFRVVTDNMKYRSRFRLVRI